MRFSEGKNRALWGFCIRRFAIRWAATCSTHCIGKWLYS